MGSKRHPKSIPNQYFFAWAPFWGSLVPFGSLLVPLGELVGSSLELLATTSHPISIALGFLAPLLTLYDNFRVLYGGAGTKATKTSCQMCSLGACALGLNLFVYVHHT